MSWAAASWFLSPPWLPCWCCLGSILCSSTTFIPSGWAHCFPWCHCRLLGMCDFYSTSLISGRCPKIQTPVATGHRLVTVPQVPHTGHNAAGLTIILLRPAPWTCYLTWFSCSLWMESTLGGITPVLWDGKLLSTRIGTSSEYGLGLAQLFHAASGSWFWGIWGLVGDPFGEPRPWVAFST